MKGGGEGVSASRIWKNSVEPLGYVGCGTNGTIRKNLGNNFSR
jgi:hypothetical protein